MKYNLKLFILLLWLCCFQALSEDSIPSTDLQELVVKSERSWIEDGVFNFIPSKKEKQLSTSVGSLITMMNLPMLKGEGDNIETSAGESVTVFINGEPATQTDLATFWPKNVKKVEYMVNPTGGQYTGVARVINFVVADYEVGGVTRIYGRQSVPLDGFYRLSSKLNYKKMSYGVSVNYIDDHKKPTTTREDVVYNDIYYSNTFYDQIIQTSTGETENKYENLNLTLNARYTSEKFRTVHSFGLRWYHQPGNLTTSSCIWSEDLFSSDSYSMLSKTRSLSPQLSGSYNYTFSSKWTAGAYWNYANSHNNDYGWSQLGDNSPIENGMRENVNTLSLGAYLTYYMNPKLIFQLLTTSSCNWFESTYSGSANEKRSQFREEFSGKLSAYWYPMKGLSFSLGPGLNQIRYSLGSIHTNYIEPSISFSGSWNPSRRLMMNFNMSSSFTPATAGETNPVMIQSSDLMWIVGNPMLKPRVDLMGFYTLSYNPFDWFSLNPRIFYLRFYHYPLSIYEAAPEDLGGVVMTNTNASPSDDLSFALNMSVYLFNGRLSVTAGPDLRYFKTRGVYDRSLVNFSCRASVGYTIGNFYLRAYYQSKNKVLERAGDSMSGQSDQFSLSGTYGWKDLNIELSIDNPFHSRFNSWEKTLSDVYSIHRKKSAPGRGVTLELTYTFGYGKQVDRTIDVTDPSEIESSRYATTK